jgi:hypothetical protein
MSSNPEKLAEGGSGSQCMKSLLQSTIKEITAYVAGILAGIHGSTRLTPRSGPDWLIQGCTRAPAPLPGFPLSLAYWAYSPSLGYAIITRCQDKLKST